MDSSEKLDRVSPVMEIEATMEMVGRVRILFAPVFRNEFSLLLQLGTETNSGEKICSDVGNWHQFDQHFVVVDVAERTVKKLRLTKALTIPEGTLVSHACPEDGSPPVDAVLLTDSNALLSGIVTDKTFQLRPYSTHDPDYEQRRIRMAGRVA